MSDNNLREAYFVYRDRVVMLEVLQYNFFDYYENWSYLDSNYIIIYFSYSELYKNHFIGSSVLFSNRNVYFNPFSFTSKNIITSQNGALMRTIDNEYFNIFAAGNKVVSWIQSPEEPVLQSSSISFTVGFINDIQYPLKKRNDGNIFLSSEFIIFNSDIFFNQITFFLLEYKDIKIHCRDEEFSVLFKAPDNTQFFQITLPYFTNSIEISFSSIVKIDNIFIGNTPICGNRALYYQKINRDLEFLEINPLLHVLPEFITFNSQNKKHEYKFIMNSLASYFIIMYIYDDFYQNFENIDYKFSQVPLESIRDEQGTGFKFLNNLTIITAEMENKDYLSNLGMYILPIDSSCLVYYSESEVNNTFFIGKSGISISGTEECNESFLNLTNEKLTSTSVFEQNDTYLSERNLSKRFFCYDMNPLNYVIKYFDNDFDYLKYFSFSLIPSVRISLGRFYQDYTYNISLFDRLDKFNYFCLYAFGGVTYNQCLYYADDLCAYQSRGVKIPSLVVNQSFTNPVWQPLKKNINTFRVTANTISDCELYLFII